MSAHAGSRPYASASEISTGEDVTMIAHSSDRRRRPRRWAMTILCTLLGVALLRVAAPAAPVQAQDPLTTVIFEYTGWSQQWTVPAGVFAAEFDVYGAQGGSNLSQTIHYPGGTGGRATAAFPLTPGDTITIMVGGKGTDQPDVCGTGKGGFNGGGNSPGAPQICPGSGGGGASDVRIGGTDLAHRVLVAGGGGGAGNVIFCTDAGAGGGLTGGSAACTPAGGSGGNQDGSSGSGLLGQGGDGQPGRGSEAGGGGGGGYYGGGGGKINWFTGGYSGGGGSGFGPADTIFQNGAREGHGRIVITYFVESIYVTDISPNSGPEAGGTLVTFTGVGFSTVPDTTDFYFGEVLAAPVARNVQCQSSTRCTGITPPGTGTVEVQPMLGGAGPAGDGPTFTYVPAPSVTGLSPSSGPGVGGTRVTISGANLVSPLGPTVVTFGSTPATGVTCAAATQCSAISPPGSGTVSVRVTAGGQTSADTPADDFTYVLPLPTLTSLSPNTGPAAGGTVVTINGANLTSPVGHTTVAFGSAPATAVSCTATACTATSPAGTGTVNVTATTAGGTSNALPYAYVPAPALTSLSPSSGPEAGGTVVTLTGSNLDSGDIFVTFGPHAATQVSCARSTMCTATSPAGTGTVNVLLATSGGVSNALPYTYVAPPAITSLTPNQGPAAGGTAVTIQGSGFSPTRGATTVTFGGAAATGVSCASSTQCSAASPPGSGVVQVRVTVGGQSSADTPADDFTYLTAPAVTGLSPNQGPAAGGTTVTIQGSGFSMMPGATSITFGTSAATTIACSSSTSCTATSPPGSGTVHVRVTVAGQTSADTPADDFTYLAAPTVTGLSPNSGPAAGGTVVTITGSGFSTMRGATAIGFGSAAATAVSCSSVSQCSATSPPGMGTVSVRVTVAGQTSPDMPADNFTYHSRPVVTGLNPSVGLAEGGDSVTVSGSGFSTMPGATSITFGGAAAGSVSCPSTTQCTATSPPGIGTVSVLVTVGGQTSADTPADNFTYLPFGPAPRSSGPAVAPGFGAAPAAPLTPPTGRRGG